jgi:hypothetical protein
MGEPREVDVEAASPKAVALGERCDPFEVVNHCDNGAWCDVPDGMARDSPTCLQPVESCPFDFPTLESSYAGNNLDTDDQTLASCTYSRGNVGTEQGHVFVAPAAATYRFVATSGAGSSNAANTLFVRSHCQYGHASAELGCVHQVDNTTDPSAQLPPDLPLTLDLPLSAGQKVYAFVEAWWVGGGDYTLSVEALD